MEFYEDILIDDIKTATDWGFWTKHKDIGVPNPQYKQVKIPARNGLVDYTEALGAVRYDSRTITIELLRRTDIDRFNGLEDRSYYESIDQLKSKVLNAIQGKQVKIIFPDDIAYYWLGRVSMTGWEVSKGRNPFITCTLTAICDPFKYSIASSAEDWLWNPFDFETGIINEAYDIPVTNHESTTIGFSGDTINTPPVITCSANGGWLIVTKGNEVVLPKYDLVSGSQVIYDLEFESGDYDFELGYDDDNVSASSSIRFTVDTRGGML